MVNRYPDDISKDERIQQIIRVNHAGEYGAKQIYAGQLAVLNNTKEAGIIRHMAEQEEKHLQAFSNMIVERNVRPTALMPIWHVAGFALGAATAILGKEAAMACTVAVEEVIDEHYAKQLDELDSSENTLKKCIKKFRDEELEHRDIGLENDAEQAPGYELLTQSIKMASKAAIWLSTRI